MKKKRVFSTEQKMEVLREVEQNGMVATCRKHDIAQSLYYQWKRKFDQHGIDGLQGQYHRVDPQVKELEKENERLKKIVAKQALELEVKSELLKKTSFRSKRSV